MHLNHRWLLFPLGVPKESEQFVESVSALLGKSEIIPFVDSFIVKVNCCQLANRCQNTSSIRCAGCSLAPRGEQGASRALERLWGQQIKTNEVRRTLAAGWCGTVVPPAL